MAESAGRLQGSEKVEQCLEAFGWQANNGTCELV